jgi:hypothetical protein
MYAASWTAILARIPQPQEAMSVGNVVFTALFLLEGVLKCTALGPKTYFTVGV